MSDLTPCGDPGWVRPPLHLAVVQYQPEAAWHDNNARRPEMATPTSDVSAILVAAESGDVAELNNALEAGGDIESRNDRGATAL